MAFQAQKELLKNIKNPIIFDIGAYNGSVSLDYKRIFEDSEIYAFEPSKTSFDMLVESTKNSDIKCFNTAIGNINGKIEFNINQAEVTNSVLNTDKLGNQTWGGHNWLTTVEKKMVDICTIDYFIEKNNIDKVDILKMDTQGTEYDIIEGSINSISQNKIKVIYTEIITMPTYDGQRNLDEIIKLLRENNFNLYNIYGLIYTDYKKLMQFDAIFVHESFYEFLKNNINKNV